MRTDRPAAQQSPEGGLSRLFGSSGTSPPSHVVGFEQNKDSFLRSCGGFQGQPTHDNSLSKNNLRSSHAWDASLRSDLAPVAL